MAGDCDNFEVKRGSVTVQVCRAPVTVKLKTLGPDGQPLIKTYESWQITFYEGSERTFARRNTREKAKKRAEEIAERLSKIGPQAEFLPENERRIYVLSRDVVRPLGLAVDDVCRRYADLQKRIKNGTLEQAVDFFNDHGQRLQLDVTTTEIFALYIEEMENTKGAGKYHLRDTHRYVGNFVEAYPGKIGPIITAQIDRFLKGLGGKARNKNNHRDAIIAFFNFAQRKGFLPYNQPHAAKTTTPFEDARKELLTEADVIEALKPVDIYTPDEMRRILKTAPIELRPSIEIKAFSGVRTEEIVRIWWLMVAEAEGCIKVPDEVGKITSRHVRILANLGIRLAAYDASIKQGRVACSWASANSLYHAWKRVCDAAGVPYKRNAFRNSYFSYRLVIVGEIGKVALEGGTSQSQLEKDYISKAPISRAQAEDWFSI